MVKKIAGRMNSCACGPKMVFALVRDRGRVRKKERQRERNRERERIGELLLTLKDPTNRESLS